MNDYMLLMHNDAPNKPMSSDESMWDAYFTMLNKSGRFQGGSSIGEGVCISKAVETPAITAHLVGYIKVQAHSLSEAQELVTGNPVYEAGGTVEIRELPRE